MGELGMIVTRDMALRIALHGACFIPEIGRNVSKFNTFDLIWVEDKKIFDKAEVKSELPLWALSVEGFGNGYGYGYGNFYLDGYGNGNGYGNEYKNGYGDFYLDGDGNGNGNGYGDRNGDRNGEENGDKDRGKKIQSLIEGK